MLALASVMLLAGSALAAPAAVDARSTQPSCSDRATTVDQWSVKNFDFHASYTFSTPAHQNSQGYVYFTLENEALDFKTSCTGVSGQLQDFFYGQIVYNCTAPVGGNEASFTFSRPSNELKLTQTWTCADEGSRFWAQGAANLTLKCDDKTWTNPDWKMGQIYSSRTVSCDLVDATVPITSKQAVA
ncbi:uncharacterized protein UV8b_00232 [Ustilaginoidea virens]|uniref:AA1-like domain-containing protein n=1 Tax=Ustilaginoidea virens TaxID=1159556 RepID=A0A8E5MDD4_USTVR|nr:uncharacterized protein UV8b_00232 [Ustilaginoidea virens]QUC15991.1 hypothetical protein UV8b_00232 [Ustilaginoidea virens]